MQYYWLNKKNNNNNNYISYSIYLDKGNITTYEFGLNNDDTNYNIEFNNGNEKSIIIKENDVEALKGIIRKNNDNTTIELSSDNINLGTITINDNNININIILAFFLVDGNYQEKIQQSFDLD